MWCCPHSVRQAGLIKLSFFLFVLGFPLAIVLAWAYKVTPQGIQSDSGSQPASVQAPSSDRYLVYGTFALVLLVAGIQLSNRFSSNSERANISSAAIKFAGPTQKPRFKSDACINPARRTASIFPKWDSHDYCSDSGWNKLSPFNV
jgi:hypothetical protein